MRLLCSLSSNRDKLGTLEAVDSDGVVLFEAPCLARSDDMYAAKEFNKGRNPAKKGGDLPEGTYTCKLLAPYKDEGYWHSYGPNGQVSLDPIRGQALMAKANGRTGLWIHGGDPSANKWQIENCGGLRFTHGCLRLANDDMKRLYELLSSASGVVEMEVTEK